MPFPLPIWLRYGACASLIAATALPAQADLAISGASTVLPIVKKAAERFSQHTQIAVSVQGGGSEVGVRDVLAGVTQLGMVSRNLHADEHEQLQVETLGYDGVALIINQRNPLQQIDRTSIVQIFNGTLTRWQPLNGQDKPLVPVVKDIGRSTRELFDHFFGLNEPPATAYTIGSDTAAILYVAADPYAIGYVSIGSTLHAQSKGSAIKMLDLDGITANRDNVRNGRYPLLRPLNLVYRAQPNVETQQFLAFMRGSEGQRVVADAQFIPLHAEHAVP